MSDCPFSVLLALSQRGTWRCFCLLIHYRALEIGCGGGLPNVWFAPRMSHPAGWLPISRPPVLPFSSPLGPSHPWKLLSQRPGSGAPGSHCGPARAAGRGFVSAAGHGVSKVSSGERASGSPRRTERNIVIARGDQVPWYHFA